MRTATFRWAAGVLAGLGASCARPGLDPAVTTCPPPPPAAEPPAPAPPPTLPSPADPAPRDYPGLHNVVAFAPGLLSGSAPDGPDGFDTLRDLGVRTVISVDGAMPDAPAARARGLRYVHRPIGYDGVDRPRALEIARALRDLPGPVYIHCHHGKHRSAAAAGAAGVALGRLTPEAAAARMRVSGTAPEYAGLFECVAGATPAAAHELDAASAEFPETCRPSTLVDGMVRLDAAFDRLRAVQAAGWRTPRDHPDIVPAAEAGMLADLLRTLRDDPGSPQRPPEFAGLMRRAADSASALEQGLVEGLAAADLSARFKVVAASCTSCHARFRD